MFSENIDFVSINLAESQPNINERYDLCISLEVAEHLQEERAESFIDLLCQASDTILFGAAIKHQGGANHVNEQWQSYWIKLFKSRGYECIDCIRGGVWNEELVEWWYKQNTFLFIGPSNIHLKADDLRELERPMIDVVHPTNYEDKIRAISAYQDTIRDYYETIAYPTLRFSAGCFKRWFGFKLSKIVGKSFK